MMKRGAAAMFDPIAIYQSAIRNADGTINAGYVILFKIIRVWLALLIVTIAAGAAAFLAAWELKEGRVDALVKVLTWFSVAVGTISSAIFITSLPGIAAFIWSDSHNETVRPGTAPPPGVIPGAAKIGEATK